MEKFGGGSRHGNGGRFYPLQSVSVLRLPAFLLDFSTIFLPPPTFRGLQDCYRKPLEIFKGFVSFDVFGLFHGVIMRLYVSLLLTIFLFSQKPSNKNQTFQQSPKTEKQGTQDSPFVVKVLPTPKTPEEAKDDKNDRDTKTANDRNLVYLTGILALVGLGQLIVYGYQAKKLRETVESAGEQSAAMERHIEEAARSADAMENIAKTIEAGNKAVMRAYLTAVIGVATYQERRPDIGDLKFEAKPQLTNTGNTPAR